MSAASGSSSGLFAAARNSAATLLTAGRTRLELLGNEIKEEKLRAVHLLLVSQLLAFCLALGTILGVALLVSRSGSNGRPSSAVSACSSSPLPASLTSASNVPYAALTACSRRAWPSSAPT